MRSLDAKLADAQYRPSGFDYMRLFLSIGVIIMHSFMVSYGLGGIDLFWHSWANVPFRLILPLFFALSGFLVMGSFERCRTLIMFFGLRVIRIWPALLMETILSAFVLGPLLTKYDLNTYFGDPLFIKYFWNMLGHPQFVLPGLFLDNPLPRTVNGQLWTVPFELLCYILVGVMAAAGLGKHRIVAPFTVLALTASYFLFCVATNFAPAVDRPFAGPLLVISFAVGASAYLYRHVIPYSMPLAIGAAVLTVTCMMGEFTQILACVPIGYLTVFIGVQDPRRLWFIKGADYSYGIFLYGFPIQQTLAHFGIWAHTPLTNSIASVAVAALFAAFSWTFVEKPALRLRSVLKKAEGLYLSVQSGMTRAEPL